ncbi:autotransporter domain-containing protein [Arenimonas sp.]|uniref:autotransporter family protein n=1 Tax=Arenimonas sp. TaxID=1872635 RepID=UPI0039E6AF78
MSFQSAVITKAAAIFGHGRSLAARASALCVLLLLGAWSGSAQASFGCYLQHTSTQFQQGAPGATYNHSFTIVDDSGTSCAGTISGTVSITGDTTGGGTLNNGGGPVTTFNWSGPGGSSFSFTSTTGTLPGGDLAIQADCLVGCFGGSTFLTYFDESSDLYDFHATTPTTVVTTDLQQVTIGAKSLYNNNPATETVSFYNVTGTPILLATDTPDVNGEVSYNFFSSTPGTYALRAEVNCIIITATSTTCPPPDIDYSVTVEATSLSANDLSLETLPSTPLPLSVTYRSPSLLAPDGSYVFWNISSSPPGGDGSIDNSSQTSGGIATADFSASVPGEYQVQASTNCFSCFAPSMVTFTVTVINRTIVIVSGDGQTGATNQPLDDPLVAQAQNNGIPTPGVGITWAIMSGSASLSPTGAVTDGAGNATVAVTMGATPGPVVVRATRNDDTSKFVEFNLNSTLTRDLVIVSGNNQSAPTGQNLPQPLFVRAIDNATGASGVQIDWSVVSGSASFPAPSTTTNAAGLSNTQVTLGATAGPIVVRATRADDTGQYVDFNLTATLTRQLVIVSGNGQEGSPNATLASPFVVEARNNNVAAPGTGVTWSIVTGGGSLSDTSTTTDGSGHADSTLTLGSSGSVTVKAARSDDSSVYVLFNASTLKLADLPGMSPTQRAIAEAIDSFCPELGAEYGGGGGGGGSGGPPSTDGFAAATATVDPSDGQYDLWQQCQELITASGSDPQGVLDALNELYADIALVQSEAGLIAARAQFDNIKVRIAALRSGTQRTSFGGLAFTNTSGSLPIGSLLQGLAEGDNPDSASAAGFTRWGFFAAGSIGRVDTKPGDVTPGYDSDITGLTIGFDYRKSDSIIFGGTIGYTKQTDDLLGREGELDTHGYSVSLFGTWYKADSWYTDAVLSWGRNTYEAERWINYTLTGPGGTITVIDQHARSESDGDSLTFAATVGRDFNKNGWGFGPYLRLLYTRLEFDEMVEETDAGPGSGLALVVDARELTSFSGVLGGKLTYAHSTSWGVMIPHVQLEWQHEFKDDPSQVTAHFLFDPSETPFTVTGDSLDTDYLRLGFGMSFVLTKGRSGFFMFERSFQDRITQNRLALGLRLEF